MPRLNHPILYSFRRCPYAIRARMTIRYSQVVVELREVVLRNKPQALKDTSPKATVPVLVLNHKEVIDESLDIMLWALQQHDPDHWLDPHFKIKSDLLIQENDHVFKRNLDLYKYAVRYPEHPIETYRQRGELFLKTLELHLQHRPYLMSNNISMADIAIMPFIRQFVHVDQTWFNQSPYANVQRWLQHLLDLDLFQHAMKKYPPWQPDQAPHYFPQQNES